MIMSMLPRGKLRHSSRGAFFYDQMSLSSDIISQKDESFKNKKTKRVLWDNLERLFHSELNDLASTKTVSKVFDPRLSSLLIERAYRVMAQLGIGKVVGNSGNDIGDAKLKNLLLEKYVIPNAKSQFDLLTKFRMVDLYSNLYGSFDVMVDHNVRKGYTGPDMWLLNKRDVFEQVGAVSFNDADQVIIRTWRPISFFEGLKKDDGFKNVPKIVEILKKKSGSKQGRDSENISKREENQYSEQAPDGYFEVLSRYEKDRWVDISVEADLEFRDQKNPHDNDELPVVRKYSIPLLDDPDGMGDGERGMGMQMVLNSNWNLYSDGQKLSMYPPVLLNKDAIAQMSSIKWGAAAKWLVRGNVANAAQVLPLNPLNIQNFNNTMQAANASLLNAFGTSDTTVSSKADSGFGKTPQALEMQQQRESTRDNADRFYMEQFVKEVMRKMVNLLNKKQSSQISIRMFPEEVERVAREYPEIKESYSEDTGKLTVPKGKKNMTYDYEIVSGSTFAMDQKAQQENLAKLLELYRSSQSPQGNLLVNDLKQAGFNLNFGELFKRVVASSGIQDWDKILTEMTEGEKGQNTLDQDKMAFQQALQQAQAGVNQVPPTPQAQPSMGGIQ